MKKLIFVLSIFAAMMLCGCAATADMELGIDTDNNAYIRIAINVNYGITDEDTRSALRSSPEELMRYYRDELGFECQGDFFESSDYSSSLIMTKSMPADSFKEAFDNLKQMLTDPTLTPFTSVSCDISDTVGEYAYRIKGEAELYRVIENIYASGISKGVSEAVAAELEQSSDSVTLSMPDQSRVFRLSYDVSDEISLEGRVTAIEGVTAPGVISNNRDAIVDVVFKVSLGICGVSLLGIIIGGIIRKHGKKKDNGSL